MATYHCSMKIGTSGKMIPHFEYIKREGKFSVKNEDLVCTNSGNIPIWAENDRDFWTACAIYDKRSYRELEFSLPNELSREEQVRLVDEFIREIIPDNPYTYAIHEVESSIYGEKNPHCHLIFSERLLDDRSKDIKTKEEFFKRRGVSRSGNIYGGSIKDRSWAGYQATGKIYAIREHLANKINDFYMQNGIDKQVSSFTLKKQYELKVQKGNIEEAPIYQEPVKRINERIFIPNSSKMKKALREDVLLPESIPDEIQERIYRERSRMIHKELSEQIKQHNKDLLPTEDERNVAISSINSNLTSILNNYESPFSIFRKQLEHDIQESSNHTDAGTTRLYSVLIAENEEREKKLEKYINENDRHFILAEVIINRDRLFALQSKYRSYSEDKIREDYINHLTDGVLEKVNEKIRSKASLISFAEKEGRDAEQLKIELESLLEKRKGLFCLIDTDEAKAEIHKMKEELLKKANALYIPIRELEKIRDSYKKGFTRDDWKKVNIYKEKIRTVGKKHERWKRQIQEKSDHIVQDIEKSVHEHQESISKTEFSYRQKLLDAATAGKYKALLGKIRSKKSLIEYQKKQGKDTSLLQKELRTLEKELHELEATHTTPELAKKAHLLYIDNMERQKNYDAARQQKRIQRVSRKKHLSQRTKARCGTLDKALRKIIRRNSYDIGAASVHQEDYVIR